MPANSDRIQEKLRQIYLKAEQDLLNTLSYKHSGGLIDYAEQAALQRVQQILIQLQDDCWRYVPVLIESNFYVQHPDKARLAEPVGKHLAGYLNAGALTSEQTAIVETLTASLMSRVIEASHQAVLSAHTVIGRLHEDQFRKAGLASVAQMEAAGGGVWSTSSQMMTQLRADGLTAYVDKAGKRWGLYSYCSMVTRTTSRQAENVAVMTRDPEQDLFQISSHGTTCPACAPYEGRVYSKSGENPDYPPLSAVFGKIDASGPSNLMNSYLGIHPNCLVPGGAVLAEGVVAHFCREYRGPVITLETSNGNRITVTPNHPILTTEGFIPAGMLHKNCKIIETTGRYGSLFGKAPNDVNIPTPVEKIVHSIVQSGCCAAVRVKGAAVQFHGDGLPDSEVDIVFSDGFGISKLNPLRSEPIKEENFPPTHFRRLFFFAKSALLQIFNSTLRSTNSIVRRLGFCGVIKSVPVESKQLSHISQRSATFFCNLHKSKPLTVKEKKVLKFCRSRFHVSWRYLKELFSRFPSEKSTIDHGAFDGVFGCSEMIRHLCITEPLAAQRLQDLLRQNALIVSNLIHVDTSEYCGKVYNLQTKYGFYTYNSIVTHNCLHVLMPYSTVGLTKEQIERDKVFSSFRSNPPSMDPRSAEQIGAYRKQQAGRQKYLRMLQEYQKYRMALGDKVPKTAQTFIKHKMSNDETYQNWKEQYSRL